MEHQIEESSCLCLLSFFLSFISAQSSYSDGHLTWSKFCKVPAEEGKGEGEEEEGKGEREGEGGSIYSLSNSAPFLWLETVDSPLHALHLERKECFKIEKIHCQQPVGC